MNFQAIDEKTKLLTDILNCGYGDLPRLFTIIRMGEDVCEESYIGDIVENSDACCCKITYNYIMDELMHCIVFDLARELDQITGEDANYHYRDIIETCWGGPFLNYADSWFQFDSLDAWGPGDSKDKILVEFKNELDELNKACNGE